MLFGIVLLISLAVRDIILSSYIIGTLVSFVIVSILLIKLSVKALLIDIFSKYTKIKLSVRNLKSNSFMTYVQIIAVALTFFSLALITTLRDDLIQSWQSKVPDNAPNVFVINLSSNHSSRFITNLDQLNINHSPMYPIIRGRLSKVNNTEIDDYINFEVGRYDNSVQRDLSLTWSNVLPDHNTIHSGKWPTSRNMKNTVSIEQGIAENLDISIGDILTFMIDTRQISAEVTSIRSVEWESFTPNFYMIFSPGTLDGLPTTYLASFYLKNDHRYLISRLVNEFPSATFFDVEFLLNRIRQIVNRVGYAVEAILYFSVLASILVFISIETIIRKHRIYSTAVFKTVGASTDLIQSIYRTEFILIGVIAGAIAYFMNLLVSYGVTNYIIEGNLIFNFRTAILCLIIAPLVVVVSGYISINRTKSVPVKLLIQER